MGALERAAARLAVATALLGSGPAATAAAAAEAAPNVVAWGYDSRAAKVPRELTDAVAIAAGDNHALALRADGTVLGWGYNGEGAARPPKGLRDVVAIAAGHRFSAAVRADGTVVMWGRDRYGVLDPPPGLRDVAAISAGSGHVLALRRDGSVVGWGDDTHGQASPPALLDDVVAVTAGSVQSWAIRADGTSVGWGGSTNGCYLRSLNDPGGEPEKTEGATEFALRNAVGRVGVVRYLAADTSGLSVLLLRSDGRVWWRGPTNTLSSEPPTQAPSHLPAQVARLRDVTAIATAGRHHLALRAGGTVVAWGQAKALPVGLRGVTAIDAGDRFGLALIRTPGHRRTDAPAPAAPTLGPPVIDPADVVAAAVRTRPCWSPV
jgi:alpha-tubulin suppressor-like RCC1 family protein